MNKTRFSAECPDVLAEAKLALKDCAKNVFVMRAGAFADFRLDAPPGFVPAPIDRDLFDAFEKNERRHASMRRVWYEDYARRWNAVNLEFPENQEIKFQINFSEELDRARAAFSLFSSILCKPEERTELDEQNFPFVRKMMDLPYIHAFRPFCETFSHLLAFSDELRVVNARQLSRRKNDACIRACAVSLSRFLSSAISSL